MDTHQKLNSIKDSQKTIDALLQAGDLVIRGQKNGNCWEIEPLHQGELCSIGFVHIKRMEYGHCERHIHHGCKEYLIVLKGRIILNVDGHDVRELSVGECGVVHPNQEHYSRPLVDDTKLLYICVPADIGMNSLINLLGKTNGR